MFLNRYFFIILGWVLGCGAPSGESNTFIPPNLDRRDNMRYQQYLVEGKRLYLTHCSNCHQRDGKGFRRVYPPLAGADYLMDSVGRAVCIIRYGLEGSIKVNEVEYNMVMAGNAELKPLEIAEILTYIGNSWGNQTGFIEVQDVQVFLKNCGD